MSVFNGGEAKGKGSKGKSWNHIGQKEEEEWKIYKEVLQSIAHSLWKGVMYSPRAGADRWLEDLCLIVWMDSFYHSF